MVLNIELNKENFIMDLWGDERFSLLTGKIQVELISKWRKFLKLNIKLIMKYINFIMGK